MDGTGIQLILAALLQGFRPALKMHIGRIIKLGVCKQHYGREAFSSRNSLCYTIFCASEYQAAAELNGIILISMDNLIMPGGLTAKQLQTYAAE